MPGRYWSFLGLAMLCVPSPAWAGAWTLEKDKGQLIVSGTLSQANNIFDGSRSLGSTPRYRKFELQALVEYGLTDRFTLMASPAFQYIDIAAPTDASRGGLGYSEFGARYRFWQDESWVFSGQTLLRVPGTQQNSNPAAIGYTEPEIEMRALLGKAFSIGNLPAFFDLQAAQRFRFGDPPSEFRFDATFGIQPAPQWLLLAQSFNVFSEGAGSGGLYPAYDYSKLQLSVVYSFTPTLALQLGAFATVTGRNALQENGLVSGIWYKF
jgi:hypothetical protein